VSFGEIREAYLRAIKDGGDTDLWAARTLHAVGIHTVDTADGEVPVLPSMLELRLLKAKGER
jgi:hypothetical protein